VNQFFEQFGLDWKLFLSQLINFALILLLLRVFVYKPVLKMLKERQKKIQEGLDKAKEADVRLKEIDHLGKEKIKQAEHESMQMIKTTEEKAKALEVKLQKKIEENHQQAQKDLEVFYKKQQEEAKAAVVKHAVELVKQTLIKTVQMKPGDVDDALIKKALGRSQTDEAAESIKHE
jgi:F-type H+-transporting ATPase subunit b